MCRSHTASLTCACSENSTEVHRSTKKRCITGLRPYLTHWKTLRPLALVPAYSKIPQPRTCGYAEDKHSRRRRGGVIGGAVIPPLTLEETTSVDMTSPDYNDLLAVDVSRWITISTTPMSLTRSLPLQRTHNGFFLHAAEVACEQTVIGHVINLTRFQASGRTLVCSSRRDNLGCYEYRRSLLTLVFRLFCPCSGRWRSQVRVHACTVMCLLQRRKASFPNATGDLLLHCQAPRAAPQDLIVPNCHFRARTLRYLR